MAEVKHQGHEPFRTKSGELLTDEIIEELSREAEAGYDLTNARAEWIPVGPPSPDDGISEKDAAPRVSFRASRAVYEAAREAMERYVQGDLR